jgi:hypothetical protein
MRLTYIFLFLLLIIAMFAILSSPRYTGNMVAITDTNHLLSNTEGVKDAYNDNFDNVPGLFKTLFGNEMIELTINMEQGDNETLFLKTNKGKIMSIDKSGNSTLKVWTDETTINTILSSDDQIRAVKEALKDKKLYYKAVKFKTKIKTMAAGFGYKIWNLIN